jgi:hypothetical protein
MGPMITMDRHIAALPSPLEELLESYRRHAVRLEWRNAGAQIVHLNPRSAMSLMGRIPKLDPYREQPVEDKSLADDWKHGMFKGGRVATRFG